MSRFAQAPEFEISTWVNTPEPISLDALKGKVVVATAFQMLCPGCVEHGLPQLSRVHDLFDRRDVAALALHTVFEHQAVQGSVEALKAFLHEYGYGFPVGIDRADPAGGPLPLTMARYHMRGTPTFLLIDREGRLRRQIFGHVGDLQLGAEIMALICEQPAR